MADLFLNWNEAHGEQLPHICVQCGAPATEWADWQIGQARDWMFSLENTRVDVTLPVCPRHRRPPWLPGRKIVARHLEPDGLLLNHVSPGFVEAVWDYRDGVIPHQPAPCHGFSNEDDFAEDEDFIPYSRAARRSPRPAPPDWSIWKILAIVLAVMFLAPCAVMIFFTFLALLLSLTIS